MKTAEERKKMCVSAQSIRNLWEQHEKNAEKMDEIDTVNRHFFGYKRGGKKEEESALKRYVCVCQVLNFTWKRRAPFSTIDTTERRRRCGERYFQPVCVCWLRWRGEIEKEKKVAGWRRKRQVGWARFSGLYTHTHFVRHITKIYRERGERERKRSGALRLLAPSKKTTHAAFSSRLSVKLASVCRPLLRLAPLSKTLWNLNFKLQLEFAFPLCVSVSVSAATCLCCRWIFIHCQEYNCWWPLRPVPSKHKNQWGKQAKKKILFYAPRLNIPCRIRHEVHVRTVNKWSVRFIH